MQTLKFLSISLILANAFISSTAYSCPKINHFVDFNCDQKHRIVIIGDSIVTGFGDQENNNHGGYVKRLAEHYPRSEFISLGFPGIQSNALYRKIKEVLEKPLSASNARRNLESADLIIIDVGRNDYWRPSPSATLTVAYIRRLHDLLKSRIKHATKIEPIVAVSSLLPTSRSFQRGFIDEVNRILYNQKLSGVVVSISQDTLPSNKLGYDGLHPTSAGYAIMARNIWRYLRGKATEESLALRLDKDLDGVYDLFERLKFHTSRNSIDSDGDGANDGDEIFQYFTDPLDATSFPGDESTI